jgi:putative transposase
MATFKGKVLYDTDSILFLITLPKDVFCEEASRCSPHPNRPAHDSFYRLLEILSTDTSTLWQEAKTMVDKTGGALVLDDSALDKPYTPKTGLVTH